MSRFLYYILFLANISFQSAEDILLKNKSKDAPNTKLLQEFKIPPWAKTTDDNFRAKRSLKYKLPTVNTEGKLEGSGIVNASNNPLKEKCEKTMDTNLNLENHTFLLKRTFIPTIKKVSFSSLLTPFDTKVDHSNDNILNEVENETYRPDSNQLKDFDEKHFSLNYYPRRNFMNNYKSFQKINGREEEIMNLPEGIMNNSDSLLHEDDWDKRIKLIKSNQNTSPYGESYNEGLARKNEINLTQGDSTNDVSLKNGQTLLASFYPVDWDINQRRPFFSIPILSKTSMYSNKNAPNRSMFNKWNINRNFPVPQVNLQKIGRPHYKFPFVLSKLSRLSPLEYVPQGSSSYNHPFSLTNKTIYQPKNGPFFYLSSPTAKKTHLGTSFSMELPECNLPDDIQSKIDYKYQIPSLNRSLTDQNKLIMLMRSNLRNLGHYIIGQENENSQPLSKNIITENR